jgi:hypothetical protein
MWSYVRAATARGELGVLSIAFGQPRGPREGCAQGAPQRRAGVLAIPAETGTIEPRWRDLRNRRVARTPHAIPATSSYLGASIPRAALMHPANPRVSPNRGRPVRRQRCATSIANCLPSRKRWDRRYVTCRSRASTADRFMSRTTRSQSRHASGSGRERRRKAIAGSRNVGPRDGRGARRGGGLSALRSVRFQLRPLRPPARERRARCPPRASPPPGPGRTPSPGGGQLAQAGESGVRPVRALRQRPRCSRSLALSARSFTQPLPPGAPARHPVVRVIRVSSVDPCLPRSPPAR